jgi:hypothetical protein
MPIVQDDFELMQDAAAEAIGGAATLNGQDSYIITGCNIVPRGGSNQGTTAGILMLNGEVCFVDADLVGIDETVNPLLTWYWTTDVTYDPAGLKIFAIGGAGIDTYKITKAVIGYAGTPPAGAVSILAMKRQENLIADMVATQGIQFTKSIGFAKGTATLVSAGQYSLAADGNSFDLPFVNGTTLVQINGGIGGVEVGTNIVVRFVGAVDSDEITLTSGANILTPQGRDYTYRHGDWATLSYQGANVWSLVDQWQSGSWQVVTTFGTGWSAGSPTPRFMKDRCGRVQLSGFCGSSTSGAHLNPVFTLPSGYRPSQDETFSMNYDSGGSTTPFTVTVHTDGTVTTGISPIGIWLSSISFIAL